MIRLRSSGKRSDSNSELRVNQGVLRGEGWGNGTKAGPYSAHALVVSANVGLRRVQESGLRVPADEQRQFDQRQLERGKE